MIIDPGARNNKSILLSPQTDKTRVEHTHTHSAFECLITGYGCWAHSDFRRGPRDAGRLTPARRALIKVSGRDRETRRARRFKQSLSPAPLGSSRGKQLFPKRPISVRRASLSVLTRRCVSLRGAIRRFKNSARKQS